MRTCRRCGHHWNAHQHLRAGFDCGACPCPDYARPWGLLVPLALGLVIAALAVGVLLAAVTA